MAHRVYSPAGEPFDIPRRDTADKLILEDNWTQTAPVAMPAKKEEKTPKPKRRSRRKSFEEELEAEAALEEDTADAVEPSEEGEE